MQGKNLDWVTYYETVGIHSNDPLICGAHKMFVAHTYSYYSSDKYYFFDNGVKRWVPFNPWDIGMNAKQATTAFVYSVGATSIVVGGMVFIDAGGGLIVKEAFKQAFNTKWKEILARISMDALNQGLINGFEFDKIDWANAIAAGLIKNKALKNAVQAAIDINIKDGYNKNKGIKMIVSEFILRQATDKVFKKYAYNQWNLKMGVDIVKKVFRNTIKEVVRENFN